MLPELLVAELSRAALACASALRPMFVEMLETVTNCNGSRYRRRITLSNNSSFSTWLMALL